MSRLSSSYYDIQSHYPIVVIGSGYGGAIMASRLARAGQRVCLLEIGKEFQPGEYPNNEVDALKNLQISGIVGYRGASTGLYHVYFDEEISTFVGCGLGGTSLINANVSLRAEKRVFEDARWPQALQTDVAGLEQAYQQAEAMLKPTPYPQDFPALKKTQALQQSAEALKEKFYRPPINVTFKEGLNHVGVMQHACQLCGDCVSGCNYAAKNTLIMNYLPDAKNHGAEIFTQIGVHHLDYQAGRWIIYCDPIHFITADLVVLSAGALGSTEILLRSKAKGLSLSDQVGEHFTGNGDVLAFAYNTKEVINGIGYGTLSPNQRAPVGPCITGTIDMRERPQLDDGIVIEEGAIPGAMAAILPKVFALSAQFVGTNTNSSQTHFLSQFESEISSLLHGSYAGAMNRTQTYLVMSHDDSKGKIYLENDQVRIRWPGVGNQKNFTRVNEALTKATAPLEAVFVPNPVWSKTSGHTLVTVHPLGGCIMAEDASKGVVNHKGQVFCHQTGSEVYPNLYVCDGSIIPRSVGVNPLLTISALAERCAALLAKEHGWTIQYKLPSIAKQEVPVETIGLTFTETMRGRLSTTQLNEAETIDEKNSTPMEFTLTIVTNDLQKMLTDPEHTAKIIGTVSAPALSKEPLVVTQGKFHLFVNDKNNVNIREMIYQMSLTSVEGNNYAFEGTKYIHNDPGLDIWSDTTILYVHIYDTNGARRLCGKGILKILLADFMKQLTTIKVLNAKNQKEIISTQLQFGQFFGGALYDAYAGIFTKPAFFNADAPPRQKRKLRVGLPEVHHFTTVDQQSLRLTRYRGGNKGPVILSHGLGVSSLIFTMDTIETNLLEYLFSHGYDVWLLDYRASIDLPASKTSFSADDIALYDYPAAVAKVLQITKAKDVQMVAHCFGATTLCMSMLTKLEGVRSIVFSQTATHIVAPQTAELKAGLYLPSVLSKIGLTSLTAYADSNINWQERLFDTTLGLFNLSAEEPCQSAVCRRISFLYGQLYEHSQLNQATHDYLHDMFGLANLKSFEHLALMVRKGHIVNAEGNESYLPHLKRLALPITFIHGEENHCFLPESTAITYKLLQEKNGSKFYKRYVIPHYGHIDCIFGKNAVKDVYPLILAHLEENAYSKKESLTWQS